MILNFHFAYLNPSLRVISNESMDFNDPKEFDDPSYLMDFDNQKSTVIPPSPMVLFCTEVLYLT